MGAAVTACSDEDVNIYTDAIISIVATGDAQVTSTTAAIDGVVKDLSSQSSSAYSVGVVYSTSDDPTTSGARRSGSIDAEGNVNTSLSGLQNGVTYYYATFVTLQNKVTKYGEIKSFYTTDALVGTADAASVTSVSANLGGTLNGVQDRIEAGDLEYGISIATSENGIADGLKVLAEGSTNSFTVNADKLVPNTTYYYSAYLVLNGEAKYGNVQSFTTEASAAVADLPSEDEYVDMGTKVEWCKYNVGATKSSELGGLYGYGDISGLLRSTDLADYATGSISETGKDIALAAGMGKLPTKADFDELVAASTVTSATVDGVNGLLFTSNKTGNKLFLPAAGSRTGSDVADESNLAAYWTGTISATNSNYAYIYTNTGIATALRSEGASVRPVRDPYVKNISADVSKLTVGDLEDNGRIRIEIYNEYGSTKANPGINTGRVSFEKTMAVTFKLSGVSNNLKDGAAGSYRAGLEFAANGWGYGYWSDFSGSKYDCLVTGDGTYTVWCENDGTVEGPIVFTVDIDKLGADVVDINKVKVEALTIYFDEPVTQTVAIDNSKVLFVNKDGDGTNGRIEIYNEYGDTKGLGADYSSMKFGAGTMTINFTISGIDGNLVSGASKSYNTDISYAAASWYPSYWGGYVGAATVTGDGTYNVQCPLEASAEGAVVWTIEVYNLWKDLVNTDAVKVNINSVTVPVASK
jgi:hypothetical protein